MRLLVDAGNTRIKWALERDLSLHGHGESLHAHGDPFEALAPLREVEATVTRALVANVAGDTMRGHLERVIADRFGVPAEFAAVEEQAFGLRVAYEAPHQLGVDRWLAMLGGIRRGGSPVLIVDLGTAMTIDAVGERGRHLGGSIVPGPRLMTESLHLRTAGVRGLGVEAAAPELFAADTRAAVRGGVWHALAALVERAATRLDRNCGSASHVLLTGGDARGLLPLLQRDAELRPDLVFEGLLVWAGESRTQ